MPYVIAEGCLDIMDRSCMEECPVDCIYEGERKLYINPQECIDCGACEPVCPVEAITQDRRADGDSGEHVDDAKRFFYEVLPGKDAPVGNPGGSHRSGVIGVDTEFTAGLPQNG